jgi:tetratricopeptide (TPR) repeat protein
MVYMQLERKEDAYSAFEKALARDPKFLFPYVHLAALYASDAKHAELRVLASQALEMDPQWAGAHLLMAEASLRARQAEAAAHHARRAEELSGGKSPDPHLILARVRWFQNECGPARRHLDRYLALRTSARLSPEHQTFLRAVQDCRASETR